jgi:hypothetical protein
MSNFEIASLPHPEQWPADVVEYGPEVPLAERLEHEHDLMHSS